jgi:hypothetical protein
MKIATVIMKNDVPVAVILNPTPSKVKHHEDAFRYEWHHELKRMKKSTGMAFVHSKDVVVVE